MLPEGAGVARQVWEVESRVAASARSARRPPAAAERLGECPARPGNPRLGSQRRAERLRGTCREGQAEGGGDPAGSRGPAGFFWLVVRKPNVKLTVYNRPITDRVVFFLSLPLEKCTIQVEKV